MSELFMGTISETLANKIFTTFCERVDLDKTVDKIKNSYTILQGKLFVFTSPQTDEYIITYNIDTALASDAHIIENTVLLHRNSDYKVLYSINAIRSLNPDDFDVNKRKVAVDWKQYEKSILLTRKGQFTQLKTELHKIVSI